MREQDKDAKDADYASSMEARSVSIRPCGMERRATESPDLFWALRGGGGNFGVAGVVVVVVEPDAEAPGESANGS